MHRARLHLAVFTLVACAACETTTPIQHATDNLPSAGLEQVQPADVAVAPVADLTGKGAPVDSLRSACYAGLVDRLYSPVRLEYVDKTWTDAAFGSGGAAEAVLAIDLTKWDTTHVLARGIVIARAEARLLDVRDPEGTPLWAVGITRRLDLGQPNPPEGWPDRAAQLLADEILTQLPERDPVRAHR